jgi:hypothetical protein
MGKTLASTCTKLTVKTCLSDKITGTVTFTPDMEEPIHLFKFDKTLKIVITAHIVTHKLYLRVCQVETQHPQHCGLY